MKYETRSSNRTTMRVIFLWLISFDIHRHNMTRCFFFVRRPFQFKHFGWCMNIKCDDNVVWIKFRILHIYLYLELSEISYVVALFSLVIILYMCECMWMCVCLLFFRGISVSFFFFYYIELTVHTFFCADRVQMVAYIMTIVKPLLLWYVHLQNTLDSHGLCLDCCSLSFCI